MLGCRERDRRSRSSERELADSLRVKSNFVDGWLPSLACFVRQHDHSMKRAMFMIAGACWVLFALGFVIVLLQHIGEGAGLQCFGWMFSSGSVLIGLAHVVGFVIAAFLCFAMGACFLARGFVRAGEDVEKIGQRVSV